MLAQWPSVRNREQVFDEDSMIACSPSPEHTMAVLFVYGSLKLSMIMLNDGNLPRFDQAA